MNWKDSWIGLRIRPGKKNRKAPESSPSLSELEIVACDGLRRIMSLRSCLGIRPKHEHQQSRPKS